MTTSIENFPFDSSSSNQIHIVLKDSSSSDYTADQIQFGEYGVSVVRTGTDYNFFPWSNVAKVYQEV